MNDFLCTTCQAPLPADVDDLCDACYAAEEAEGRAAQESLELLRPLDEDGSLSTLRRVWKSVHGTAPLMAVSKAEAVRSLLSGACSMMDDDLLEIWAIRRGEVIYRQTVMLPMRPERRRLEEGELSGLLGGGDALITLHVHHCAGDCAVSAALVLCGATIS